MEQGDCPVAPRHGELRLPGEREVIHLDGLNSAADVVVRVGKIHSTLRGKVRSCLLVPGDRVERHTSLAKPILRVTPSVQQCSRRQPVNIPQSLHGIRMVVCEVGVVFVAPQVSPKGFSLDEEVFALELVTRVRKGRGPQLIVITGRYLWIDQIPDE